MSWVVSVIEGRRHNERSSRCFHDSRPAICDNAGPFQSVHPVLGLQHLEKRLALDPTRLRMLPRSISSMPTGWMMATCHSMPKNAIRQSAL